MDGTVLLWRRTDVEGLERMEIFVEPDGVRACGTVLGLEGGGFRLDHRWLLSPEWRAQALVVERWGASGHAIVRVKRDGTAWRVDGVARPDLEGAEEPDLSVTPFCNTLAIRRTPQEAGATFTLDTATIDGQTLAVTRSRQRYERQGPGRVHYVDLGVAQGFEADLVVDDEGLILHYQHLFERALPAAPAS